jgi:hypothetical protein
MNDIVLLNLRISMWGVSRVLPDHEYEVDADKAMVRATKKILECPEYEFLLQLKRSIHRRPKTLALPVKSSGPASTRCRWRWSRKWSKNSKRSRCDGA